MQTLLFAILTASLLGSVHCAGMCGPFVLLSVGNQTGQRKSSLLGLSFYHFGRLFSYLGLGAIAGAVGSAVDLGGTWAGIGQFAAFLAGGLMILFGVWALLQLRGYGSVHIQLPGWLQKKVQTGYRFAQKLPIAFRAGMIGLLSVLIPCGWLYAFVITAAGTAEVFSGMIVMLAFWLGTVPVLSVLGLSIQSMPQMFRRSLPYLTACSICALGFYTVSVRAWADYSVLRTEQQKEVPLENQIERVQELPDQTPPCCRVPGK